MGERHAKVHPNWSHTNTPSKARWPIRDRCVENRRVRVCSFLVYGLLGYSSPRLACITPGPGFSPKGSEDGEGRSHSPRPIFFVSAGCPTGPEPDPRPRIKMVLNGFSLHRFVPHARTRGASRHPASFLGLGNVQGRQNGLFPCKHKIATPPSPKSEGRRLQFCRPLFAPDHCGSSSSSSSSSSSLLLLLLLNRSETSVLT